MTDYQNILTIGGVVLAAVAVMLYAIYTQRNDKSEPTPYTQSHRYFFLWIEGASAGPFTGPEVLVKLNEGTITRDAMCRREGARAWDPLRRYMWDIEGKEDTGDLTGPAPAPQDSTGPNLMGVGGLVVFLGLAVAAGFAFGYDVRAPGSETINIGLLNNRTLGCAAGLAGAVMGAVVMTGGMVVRAIKKTAKGI